MASRLEQIIAEFETANERARIEAEFERDPTDEELAALAVDVEKNEFPRDTASLLTRLIAEVRRRREAERLDHLSAAGRAIAQSAKDRLQSHEVELTPEQFEAAKGQLKSMLPGWPESQGGRSKPFGRCPGCGEMVECVRIGGRWFTCTHGMDHGCRTSQETPVEGREWRLEPR